MAELPESVAHRFFALRHGKSEANAAGIISSDPQVSTCTHGLAPEGKRQADEAGKTLADVIASGSQPSSPLGIAIISSDFLRAKETAMAVAAALIDAEVQLFGEDVQFDIRLRERFFGDFNGTTDANYHKVWASDAEDSSHTEYGVESVDDVRKRVVDLIVEMDNLLPQGWWCILVAHGDVLQILQTAFARMDARRHRELPHLATATLRELQLEIVASISTFPESDTVGLRQGINARVGPD